MEKEEKERARQFELEKIKIESEIRLREMAIQNGQNADILPTRSERHFDAAKNIRLVPKFVEKTVDKYFPQFEKVAENLRWPREVWPTLLQSVLVGRAAEIYSSMSVEDSSDYDKVKTAILKSYELVPEAYRQKFRDYKKYESQTYVEFAREKENLFEQWTRSKQIENFDQFKQLILIEEFKRCVHQDLKTHLDDKDAKTLNEVAILSDSYALSHKKSFLSAQKSSLNKQAFTHKKDDSMSQSASSFKQSFQTPSKGSISNQQTSNPASSSNSFNSNSAPLCGYCKKRGHLLSECFKLKRKRELDKLQPSACFAKRDDKSLLQSTPDFQDFKPSTSDFMEDYKPFMSQGFVSLNDSGTDIPIKILRDTGASQTILLEGVLPLSERTFTDKSVLLQGVELGVIEVPLHKIHLKSDLVTGSVTVGVRPTLPIQGVALLLGNDLAGGKVVADPIICKNANFEKIPSDNSDI